MEQGSMTGKNKWYTRLAWVFLFLFALLWSLGAFFFWVLLGFAGIFCFLSLYYSDLKISFFENSKRGNSFQSYSGNRNTSTSPDQIGAKVIRVAIIIAGGLVILSIGFGVFSGSDDSVSVQQSPEEQPSEVETASTDEDLSFGSRGSVFYNNGEYDSALFYYNKALQTNPSDNDALYNKALVYFMKKEYKTSISIIKEYNRRNSDNDQGLWLLGDNYYESNQYDSALMSLEKAYNNNFGDPDFMQLLGDAYRMTNSPDKAKSMYLKVIERDSTNADVYLELIKVDPENAARYREMANAINKDSN